MAWNIGANDVANAMGTSVGSKALSLRKAILLAALLEFSGAFLFGSDVCKTIQNGIIASNIFEADPISFCIGMMGALLTTGIALQISSYLGLPISTTHATVGSVIGFGIVYGGMDAIHWNQIFFITLSWIISPLVSALFSYFIFQFIQRVITQPLFSSPVPSPINLQLEQTFRYLQIASACLVAFAHGANDVSNAIGPVAAVISVLQTHSLHPSSTIPFWLLAMGGFGIVLGLVMWGWRVIETVGQKITHLTPMKGFSAEFGTACTVLFASKLGLPISTTHALVGAILGVGLHHSTKTMNTTTLKEIGISWAITIPVCSFLSAICFLIFKYLFTFS